MSLEPPKALPLTATVQRMARIALFSFLLTFLSARIVVFLVMSHRLPDLYLHVGGTHLHHFNFGIVLLSTVGAYLLFLRPAGRWLNVAAGVYGVGLGLTFDEFGLWLHLGGPYWQRASFDAVVIITGLLGLIAVGPSIHRFHLRHWASTIVLAIGMVAFCLLLWQSLRYGGRLIAPRLQEIERSAPP